MQVADQMPRGFGRVASSRLEPLFLLRHPGDRRFARAISPLRRAVYAAPIASVVDLEHLAVGVTEAGADLALHQLRPGRPTMGNRAHSSSLASTTWQASTSNVLSPTQVSGRNGAVLRARCS
jgi:hypothetical protein